MNARGIPPATYLVLHTLSYPPRGGGGAIPPGGGISHAWLGVGGTLSQITPHPDLAGGTHHGVLPIHEWGTPLGKGPGTSHWGTPRKDMGPVEVLWDGDGVHPPPPPEGCELTNKLKLLPSDAGGN